MRTDDSAGDMRPAPHRRRSPVHRDEPVQITLRLDSGLPGLSSRAARSALRRALQEGNDRFGLRLQAYALSKDHLHLRVEAKSRRALARGMQGLGIRLAKGLNRVWNRKGRVFAERYTRGSCHRYGGCRSRWAPLQNWK